MTDVTPYAGRTVFVTGASGIVGSWLVRGLLAAGAAVVALVRDEDPRSEFVRSGDGPDGGRRRSLRGFHADGSGERFHFGYGSAERDLRVRVGLGRDLHIQQGWAGYGE